MSCVAEGMAHAHTDRSIRRTEILVGRTFAACAHPVAAWRHAVRSFRVLLLAGYFAAGYIAVLLTMIFAD